ncbi:outer membrane beta-barrel protein [Pseudomonas stutzeri]|nr:outer membrane beta-barrel protein [Stutzerimonas stutzeri]
MSKKVHLGLLAASVSAVVCGQAWALEPQRVRLGDSLVFIPTLQLSESYDDNFRATESNEESSWITTIAPTFALGAEGRKSGYRLSYTAVSDTFHSSSKDNNVDHHLTADVAMEFDARNRLRLGAGYHKVEETASVDQNVENDKYDSRNVGGVYTYGARSARTQIDLGANYDELRYSNSGNLNADKERDATALTGTLYYRVAPRTRTLLEVRHTDYDYLSASELSSRNLGLLAGLTWEATAKTTGSVKIGREKKKFDRSVYDDLSTGMWEIGIGWAPRSYSRFDLNTRRGYDEASDNASTVKTQTTTLSWEHDWLERLTSSVSYTRSDQDYQDTQREDTLDALSLGLTYKMRRWLDIGLSYRYADNDSDAVGESFKRNIYTLTLNASL